jgi:hypothetical protein
MQWCDDNYTAGRLLSQVINPTNRHTLRVAVKLGFDVVVFAVQLNNWALFEKSTLFVQVPFNHSWLADFPTLLYFYRLQSLKYNTTNTLLTPIEEQHK